MERPHSKKVISPVVMRSNYSQEIRNLQKETQQMEEQLKMLKIVSGNSPVSLSSKSGSAKVVVTPSKPKQTYVVIPEPTAPTQTHWSNSKSIKYIQPTTPTVTKSKQTFERVDSVGVGRSVEVKKSDSVLSGSFNEDESHQSFLEALNEWRRGSGMTVHEENENEKAQSTTKASVSVSVSESSIGGDLLKGSFDESESHQSFLDALNAWRGNTQPETKSTTNTTTKTSMTVETATTSTGNDSDSENNEDKKVNLQLKPEGTSEWGKAISEGTVSIPLNSYFIKLQRARENQKNEG